MSLLESIIMGIIQGATEFLPVSSSGHLAIFKNMFHVNTDTGIMFDILLHFGTLVAIFIVYWKDIVELIVEGFTIIGLACCNVGRFFANLFSKEKKPYRKIIETEYRKFVMLVILSTLVTMVIALPFESKIENAGNTLLVPGFCLCITSVIVFRRAIKDRQRLHIRIRYLSVWLRVLQLFPVFPDRALRSQQVLHVDLTENLQ